MYSKTCPIPVKNVRDKLIEMTPLSSLLSDWCVYVIYDYQFPEIVFRAEEFPPIFLLKKQP
jgi:hypothetical protein